MLSSLRWTGALAAALLVHTAATMIWGDFPRATDLFLVVVVFYSMGGNLVAGMLGGVVAGFATDALTGGPYGLYGLADTIVGYGSAFLAQRLVVRRASSVLLLFALAAAAQQAILVGLTLVLFPERGGFPSYSWPLLKVITVGILGAALFVGKSRFRGWMERRRQHRAARLR